MLDIFLLFYIVDDSVNIIKNVLEKQQVAYVVVLLPPHLKSVPLTCNVPSPFSNFVCFLFFFSPAFVGTIFNFIDCK